MVWESPEEQEQLIGSEQARSGQKSTCDEGNEDWGCSFDDQGPEYWEDYLGGPDDVDLERYYESYAQSYEENFYQEQMTEINNNQKTTSSENRGENMSSRTEEIVTWLAESKLARNFKNKEGFYIPKGPHVRLKDGSIVDLFDWLFSEGIKGGIAIAGFSIVYSKPNSKYGDKLSFFKIIVDAPFLPLSKEDKESDFDDDIPF